MTQQTNLNELEIISHFSKVFNSNNHTPIFLKKVGTTFNSLGIFKYTEWEKKLYKSEHSKKHHKDSIGK